MLIAMAGLPGAGKSSVAEELGRKLSAPVVSVDPIEAAMWRARVARRRRKEFAPWAEDRLVLDSMNAPSRNIAMGLESLSTAS
jgi:predicted kinase